MAAVQLAEVIGLQDGVVEFQEGQSLFAFQPVLHAVQRQHPADGEMHPDLTQQLDVAELVEPVRVVGHDRIARCFTKPKERCDIGPDALHVGKDLLLREQLAGFFAERRVAYLAGAAAHQGHRGMAMALQQTQEHDLHHMPDMQAVRRQVIADIPGYRAGAHGCVQALGIGTVGDKAALGGFVQEVAGCHGQIPRQNARPYHKEGAFGTAGCDRADERHVAGRGRCRLAAHRRRARAGNRAGGHGVGAAGTQCRMVGTVANFRQHLPAADAFGAIRHRDRITLIDRKSDIRGDEHLRPAGRVEHRILTSAEAECHGGLKGGFHQPLAPCLLQGLCGQGAPRPDGVPTRGKLRIGPAGGQRGEVLQMHGTIYPETRAPGFLRGEHQHRGQPRAQTAMQLVQHGACATAAQRISGVAVQRVLANIEIERR